MRNDIDEGPRHGFIYKAGADFEQPRLLGRPSLRGKSLLESERTLEETYDAIGGRAMAGVAWEPHSTLTLFPAYNLQAYYLEGPSTATAQTAPLALGCTEDPCFTLLSYLEQIITWDTRDDRLEPRKGRYLSLSLQEGGGPLGGDFSYLRILPEARGYLTLGNDDQFTLAARARVGTLLTRSGDPEDSAVTTRFYSGGSNAMRGFSIRRLSPLLLIPTPGSNDPDDVSGAAHRGQRHHRGQRRGSLPLHRLDGGGHLPGLRHRHPRASAVSQHPPDAVRGRLRAALPDPGGARCVWTSGSGCRSADRRRCSIRLARRSSTR